MADRPTPHPPDPARSYERAKPEAEPGMGRLDNDIVTPQQRPDRIDKPMKNSRPPHQINAEDAMDDRAKEDPARRHAARPAPVQPDHSMLDEEPDGWDLAPQDIQNPRFKRHPRTEGKGGVG